MNSNKMVIENYNLMTYFDFKSMTAREYVDFSKKIILKLKEIDPIFTNLFGWGKKANARRQIASDMHNFDEIVFEQIRDNSIAYQNPDLNNKELTWDSISFIGYSNSYSNNTRIKEGKFSIKITCGQENKLGLLMIKFPQYNYPQFIKYDFVKNLFVECINLTNSTSGNVVSEEFSSIVKREQDKIWIGWFSYISNKDVFNVLPNNIYKEYINDGTLISIAEDMPLSTNLTIVNKALEIRTILRTEKVI